MPRVPRGLSPLELLLPDGVASRAAVLGTACPDGLRPQCPRPQPGEQSDLIVIAPERAELQAAGWLERSVQSVTAGLAPDGIVYVLVPGGWRSRVMKQLAAQGLVRGTSFFHDPAADATRALVPLVDGPATYAFSSLIPTRAFRRRTALLALRSPGGDRLLSRLLPSVGFVARRKEGRPLLEWLSRLHGTPGQAIEPVLTVSWRGPMGSLVVLPFSEGADRPLGAAKIGAATPTPKTREDDVIRRLGANARRAGAEVPEPIAAGRIADRDLIVQTAVPGRSAASVLGDSPATLSALGDTLLAWIEAWNLATMRTKPLTASRLESDLTGPARRLAPLIANGDRYVAWLETRCAASVGRPLPLVASHNDLTMVNVFVDASGRLGVVDWEAADDDCLPLVDFYYAIVDANAATTRYADRAASFDECFGRSATMSSARTLEERLRSALGVGREDAELCFHSCWIRYASHEHTVAATPGPHPFLEILRSVAATTDAG